MLFERTYNDILSDSMLELTQNTKITRGSPGAKARAFLEILSRRLNDAYKTFDINLARSFISGANGRFLDLIGELVGCPRLETAAANSTVTDQTLKFYVESGTFGSINNGASIVLPAGTIVSSQSNSLGVRYRTLVQVTLAVGDSSAFVAVEALLPGTNSNVGEDILQYHDFSSYADASNNTLKVNNDFGIFSGRDPESDPNYKYRLTKQVLVAEAANLTSVRLAALSVPGVADVVTIPFFRGIGTYDILIKATTPSVSQSLIDAVQANIQDVSALGISPKARKPTETGMSFTITITPTTKLPQSERTTIETKVENRLSDYVNSLDIGDPNGFVINEAVQRVMEVDDRIKDIGVPTQPFDNISLYIPTKLQDNKVKQTLLKNYTPANDERVIIEPSLASPITIIWAQ